ncbi:MAG: hypothetical protein FWG65_13480 [Turicibacter sp.]|nr:hypothetical protein [Turicibacter sp.]
MSYLDGKRDMSANAEKAYSRGMFAMSKITQETLYKHGFYQTVTFFKWLCKNEYVMPSEYHHTAASFQLTAFYSTKAIEFAAASLDLGILYELYIGRETEESILRIRGISYVSIDVPSYVFGIKKSGAIKVNCIDYKGFLFYSEDSILGRELKTKYPLQSYSKRPDWWHNKNSDRILKKIIARKKVVWKNVIGSNSIALV